MYLKYIQIVNYKNLRKTRFEFGKGANTVIGENDSGKSNAMTAMRILLDDDYFYNTRSMWTISFRSVHILDTTSRAQRLLAEPEYCL